MGNSCSARIAGEVNDDLSDIYVLCTKDGIIIDVNEVFERELHFKLQDVKGKFIGQIMTSLMSYLHKHVFLHRFLSTKGIEASKLLYKIHSRLTKRPHIIYDLNENPIYVSLRITVNDPKQLKTFYKKLCMKTAFSDKTFPPERYLLISMNKLADIESFTALTSFGSINRNCILPESNLHDNHPQRLQSTFKQTSNDIIIICIDINEALGSETGSGKVVQAPAHASQLFYEDAVDIIRRHAYPFVYIYETVLDSFVFVVGADWTYSMTNYSACIAMYFLRKLIARVKPYISVKGGMAFGKVSYGCVGGNVRLFGDIVNLASRLENECESGEILMSNPLVDRVEMELNSLAKFTGDFLSRQSDSTMTVRSDSGKEEPPSIENSKSNQAVNFLSHVQKRQLSLKETGDIDCSSIAPDMLMRSFEFLENYS